MKKLLEILGTITIAGSGMAGLVGNAPTKTKESNLEKLIRNKRNNLPDSNNFDLSNNQDYLNYISFCYIYNKYYDVHRGTLNKNTVVFDVESKNNNSILKSDLKTKSNVIEFKEINTRVISSHKIENLFGTKINITNDSEEEQDKVSTMLGTSKTLSVTKGFKVSTGFKASIKITGSAGIPFITEGKVEVGMELNLGYENNQQWTETETITLSPTTIKIPPRSQMVVYYNAHKYDVEITGVAKVNIDPNQIINIFYYNNNILMRERVTLISLINELKKYNSGNNLFNSNKYLTVENNEIFANIEYKLTKQNYTGLNLVIGKAKSI